MKEDQLKLRRRWMATFAALPDDEFREALFSVFVEMFVRAGSVGRAVSAIRGITQDVATLAAQGAVLDGVDPATATKN